MPTTREEITAAFINERLRFDSTMIASARLVNPCSTDATNGKPNTLSDPLAAAQYANEITLKGEADEDDLRPGLQYRFLGTWQTYLNRRTNLKEKQFHFHSFALCEPHGKTGTIKYLQQAGLSPGRANLLWETFKDDAVATLRDTPATAAEILDKRFTVEHAKAIAAKLLETKKIQHVLIDVLDLLAGRHFRKRTPMLAIQRYGEAAPRLIRNNPYLLMQFPGAGFKLCDAMYCELYAGMIGKLAAIKRQALCAWNALQKDGEGNTWQPIEFAVAAIKGSVSGAKVEPLRALKLAKRAGLIATLRTDHRNQPVDANDPAGQRWWVAEGKRAANERYVASKLAELMRSGAAWPSVERIKHISDHQREKLYAALQSPVGIFIGGPGTGKSHTTAALAETLLAEFGASEVAFAAPTNKAAVRLSAAMANIGIKATSTHRLLGVEKCEGQNWQFLHNESNPLPYKVLCFDEGSMYDTNLFASALRAIPRGALILIIGDINQLPPINHGAVLRDMLTAGLPRGELTEPQRNAGDVVQACDDIRRGLRFRESDYINPNETPPKNFKILHAESPQQQLDVLMKTLEQAKLQGLDPIWDCQVMTAVNVKSLVSRKVVNELLQRELNADGEGVSGSPFKCGDKVRNDENGKFSAVDSDAPGVDGEGKVFVAKGEFGRVIKSEAKLVTVKFDGPERVVKFPRGASNERVDENADVDSGGESDGGEVASNTGCSLSLAYGSTVHSMQGSECALAIPLIDEAPGARRLASRELVFTAISRGKKLTLPIGKRSTMDEMCRKVSLPRRRTFLAQLIQKELDA